MQAAILSPLFIRVRPGLGNVRSELKMVECGRTWTDNEIKALLEIWGDSVIQKDSTRNVVAFRSIAAALEAKEYSRTHQQCREKLKALKKKYKEQTDNPQARGVLTMIWTKLTFILNGTLKSIG